MNLIYRSMKSIVEEANPDAEETMIYINQRSSKIQNSVDDEMSMECIYTTEADRP